MPKVQGVQNAVEHTYLETMKKHMTYGKTISIVHRDSRLIYSDERFRMRRELFLKIVDGISHHSIYIQQRYDGLNKNCISPIQNCIATICQLAYGTAADTIDEYTHIGETTAIECLNKFRRSVIEVYSKMYLRIPN